MPNAYRSGAHSHRPCRCEGGTADDPGPAVLNRRGRGVRAFVLDHAVRRGAAGARSGATEVAAGQIREIWGRLRAAGPRVEGDLLLVVVVVDAGSHVIRLAFLLCDLPIGLPGRVRADRAFHGLVGTYAGTDRLGRHGSAVKLDDPTTWPAPQRAVTGVHERYGNVAVTAWGHHHPRLQRRAGWAHHAVRLPIVEGALIHVKVDRQPGDRAPKSVWLWHSRPYVADLCVPRLFHTFRRGFDLEYTFRFLKQTLGWTQPRLRHPDQADRWTWLIPAVYTQLHIARSLAGDLRRPWVKPLQRERPPRAQSATGFPAFSRLLLVQLERRTLPPGPGPLGRHA